jgi:hypothetical protein
MPMLQVSSIKFIPEKMLWRRNRQLEITVFRVSWKAVYGVMRNDSLDRGSSMAPSSLSIILQLVHVLPAC